MGSSGKRKTTFAKLARESKLRQRRMDKEAKKAARKQAAELPDAVSEAPSEFGADAEDGAPLPPEGPPS